MKGLQSRMEAGRTLVWIYNGTVIPFSLCLVIYHCARKPFFQLVHSKAFNLPSVNEVRSKINGSDE